MGAENAIRKVLVLHVGALGDCVLTQHFIEALRPAWGNSAVTMAARSSFARWAQHHGMLWETCSLEQHGLARLYGPGESLPADTIRFLDSFDVIVSFLGGPGEAVSTRLAAASRARIVAIDPRPTDDTLRNGVHITRQWINASGCLRGPLAGHPAASVDMSSRERVAAAGRLARHLGASSEKIALFHPGAGSLDKCCPVGYLERGLRALIADGWVTAWIIGPDEMERGGAMLVRRLKATADLIYEEAVEAAADLICGAGVYVGNDAGATHVAALAGVRTVALFGPTDPRVWRPLGRSCQVVGFPHGGNSLDACPGDFVARLRSACGTA
jgi:hypothetical protein